MGNQLSGIAPSQILSGEHYFSDLSDFEFDCSLGSTRFFKVARAKYRSVMETKTENVMGQVGTQGSSDRHCMFQACYFSGG
ncbi:phosphoinositide 3-kinase regulatory subunit 4-like isoform X2 [Acropora muricata]|uniref:phosphoinositide 3-kinase regulatory subunit 4-like isoform X2 n=1 Tax=Acropora muricata TaxID=159855 RepID=UPI0034E4D5C6